MNQTAVQSLESCYLTGDSNYPFTCRGCKKFQFASGLVQHLESDACADNLELLEDLLRQLERGDLAEVVKIEERR